MSKVHLNIGGGRAACGAEDIWRSRRGGGSTTITSNKNADSVTCKNCKRTWRMRS